MLKLLKKIKCKLFACCGSKCSIEDTNNDGIPDKIVITHCEKCENFNKENYRLECDKECCLNKSSNNITL